MVNLVSIPSDVQSRSSEDDAKVGFVTSSETE
jgi:hypothetical protein